MRNHFLDSPISYYAIYVLARVLPMKLCRRFGRIIALMVYVFSKQDRSGFAHNLSLALGKPPQDESIKKIIRKIFINYGEYMADFFLLPQQPPHIIRQSFAFLKGESTIQKALDRGKGVILLSAHLGNWEFGGIMMRLSDYPLAVVALPHNTAATNTLVNRFRKDKGIRVIELNKSPFSSLAILKHLRGNGVVAMIGDRDFLGNGKFIDFFGRKVRFPIGPVVTALASGAAIIPAFVLKQPDGRYFGVLEDEIPISRNGSRNTVVEKNLSKISHVFEAYIRRYPEQWYTPDPITGAVSE
jgi:KDO2-lipid IV(A) lauroyltransferase